ncbi:DNA breaking-rejoining protein [Salmonella enterica subsp. enterica]|nr:DNA breaking-rejoining protein [Salmonella enterica subsp. enterica]
MDGELKNLKCNISQLALLQGYIDRRLSVASRAFPWHWEAMKKTSCIS